MRLLWLLPWVLAAADPAHTPLDLRNPLQDKNFYALSLIERDPAAAAAVASDPVLAALRHEMQRRLHLAVDTCAESLACYADALSWDANEVEQAAAALARLAAEGPLARLAAGPLRSSGALVRLHGNADAALLAAGWREAAAGMNRILRVYGKGEAPAYAKIDAATYLPPESRLGRMLFTALASLEEEAPRLPLFFQPSLRFAVTLLRIHHRDEAARLEPLETGENAAAIARLRTLEWPRYAYSAIVVLGSGADRAGVALSPTGRLRLEIAARRYHAGLAPLLVVSGGYVHPALTPFCEAIEMKKALVAEFGVPAAAVLIDPHARHTTTNIRNAARLLYRYGAPFERALITTDSFHSASVESAAFARRCRKELGYEPMRVLRRVSRFDVAVRLSLDCLHLDPSDPLDP